MRFGEIIEKVSLTGKKLKQSQYQDKGKIPIIDQGQTFIEGYTDREDLKISFKPVIIFGYHTKVVKYVDFDFVAGADGVKVVKPLEVFYPKLFYYFLQVVPLPDKGYARHFQFLENSLPPFLPLAEQNRIVAKIEELFTRLDAGVEALKKVKAQIRHYRQAVLKYAFEGKLTEKWRRNNPSSVQSREDSEKLGKDEILLSAQNDRGGAYNENMPELPKGWRWVKLGEIAEKIHYGYTAKTVTQPVGPKFLRISDIQYGSVNWDTVPYCAINQTEKQKYILKNGDLVFARTGATVGKSFLIRGKVPEAVFASYLIRINLRKSIDKIFVFNFFQSQFYWTQIHKGKIGIGQPNVNAQTLAQIIIPLPPLSEQHQIVEEIERRFSVIEQVEKIVDQSLKQAEKLRQSILKRAFEGKLVPQDPNDEPAEKLLERIRQQREQPDKVRTSKRKRRKQIDINHSGII